MKILTSDVSRLAPMGPSPAATMVIFLVWARGPLISLATFGSTCTTGPVNSLMKIYFIRSKIMTQTVRSIRKSPGKTNVCTLMTNRGDYYFLYGLILTHLLLLSIYLHS